LRSGPNEPTEHFVEAELSDYVNKTNYGRVVLKTKHMYTGNFEDWYFHGPGRYVWADGTVYEVLQKLYNKSHIIKIIF
jgi:hypothetical protein